MIVSKSHKAAWLVSITHPRQGLAESMVISLILFFHQERWFQCKWSVSVRTACGAVTTTRTLEDVWVNPA